jgi:capsular polysaccharide biosynthesis protein
VPAAVLITTLARYQTVFWIPVAQALQRLGHTPAFLTFDDPSDALIRGARLTSFNAFTLGARAAPASGAALERELEERLSWTLPLAVSHERITFGLHDTAALAEKLARHRAAAAAALAELGRGGPVAVVQELGGFLSVIGTYLAARSADYDNLFLEPSFFKGRFFTTRNTFAAPQVGKAGRQEPVDADAVKHMEAARATRAIVIPTKDRHHYTAAARKVVNLKNMRRLAGKLYEKYGRRQRHEFGHVGAYVASHARMVRNSMLLRGTYKPLEPGERFVYYPLHVPADVALTLRAPHYLDQLSLVDYLARIVPASHRLVIKEHPAQVGALDARRLRDLLVRHDNLALLPPTVNNYDALAACDLVVSINSKSGAEALLLGKPVLVLGDAFYGDSGLVTRIASPADLPGALRAALEHPALPAKDDVERFFSRVWRATQPGELYVVAAANAETFAQSLERAFV